MTKYIKDIDRVRSITRGIEADLRYLETSNSKTFPRCLNKLKKQLDEFSSALTELYSHLDDDTISEIERSKRQSSIEELELSQRNFEKKFQHFESNPPKDDPNEIDESIDTLLQSKRNIKMQSFSPGPRPELVSEIDSEMAENEPESISSSLKSYFSNLSSSEISIIVFLLLIVMIWFMFS